MASVFDPNAKLLSQIESWRSHLLDIGNRNPLVSTSFHPTRGVLELFAPTTEEIWRKLIISGDSGSTLMRFPWKRDLVPPPAMKSKPNDATKSKAVESGQLELDIDGAIDAANTNAEKEIKDWNPSVSQCLASPKLRGNDLLTAIGDRVLDRRIRTLDGYAKLSISEQGIHSLYLAFGFIKWYESADSDKEIRSPLILVPAAFARETSDSPWELREGEDDVIDNLCLRQRFKQDFGLELPPLPELEQLEEEGARQAYFQSIKDAIRKNERWDVEDRCCLGRFAFPKIAMWQDLGEHVDSIAASPICQSIGGQLADSPMVAFGDPSIVPDADKLDDAVEPGEIKAILDCDSSQMEAIVAARHGISFVLDGPPGTGKSQTIANIIADALSVGKRVLFVSEKSAALEVVKRRLDECGLGDFCLECHSHKANRKAVLEELKLCLEIPIETYPDPSPKLIDLREQRRALNNYVRQLHEPRQPIGLSMYELHGNIARLTRKGMLGKSKLRFSAPQSIARFDLDRWTTLLQLAEQHANVISNYAKHPWRGCSQQSQTLALKSEIRDNFSELADCTEKLANELALLEEAGLIPPNTTPVQLKSLINTMESCLEVPEIPEVWFASPHEVASALIDRHKAHLNYVEKQTTIPEYVDDVINQFSDDIAELSSLPKAEWIPCLKDPLAESPSDNQQRLIEHANKLKAWDEKLIELDQSLKLLVAELKLPIRVDISLVTISKLTSAAALVASDAPFKASWFDNNRTPQMLETAQQTIANIKSINAIESKANGRIDPAALLMLNNSVSSFSELQSSWQTVTAKLSPTQMQDLEGCWSSLQVEIDALSTVHNDLNWLISGLQFRNGYSPTLEQTPVFVEAASLLVQQGTYHGSWVNAEFRQQLKQRIEAILLDLNEAKELRESLESKFSHRAFLAASRRLVERGKSFAHWWSRWFGGYAKYRTELAELYKTAVPPTSTLLADLLQLSIYHKRISEAAGLFQELKNYLCKDTVYDQVESWQRNLDAIKTLETFLAKIPSIAGELPVGSISIAIRSDDAVMSRLVQSVTQSRFISAESSVDTWGIAGMSISQAMEKLSQLQLSVKTCLDAIRESGKIYTAPPTMNELLEDTQAANTYAGYRKQVETAFAEHVDDLPHDSNAYSIETWQALIRGLESADRLSKTFGSSPVLKETLCTPGRVDRQRLTDLVNSTERALEQVQQYWSEELGFINLNKPGEPVQELRKQKINDLRAFAAASYSEFEILADRFAKLASVLRTGTWVPLDRLSQDRQTISDMRRSQHIIAASEEILSKLRVQHPRELTPGELQVTQWILNAPSEQVLYPLSKAVATEPTIRKQTTEILQTAVHSLETMNEPGRFFGRLFNPAENVSVGFVPKDLAIRELPTILRKLVQDVDAIDEWVSFNRWRQQLGQEGFAVVVEELIAGKYQPSEAVDVVCAKLYQQLFDHFVEHLPLIGDFDSVRHEQIRSKYRQLDEWEIKAAAARVREYQLNREDRPRIGWLASMTSELGILKRETEKKRKHMPLRKLFNAVPSVLQRLKPCIMMSPLSVSTYLQSETLKFDLVIFDEASQVFPWDAIGAIYRGNQLIVAGDDKQLPPTSFFSRSDVDSEEEEDDIADFESILSLCKSVNMPNKRLKWHYRSRREPLIAFSNRHFYDGDLVTFPSVRDASGDAVRLEFVEGGRWIERKNQLEAKRVAELVVEHYRNKPDKSLGIIAFNASQQAAIEDAIYELRRTSSIVDALLSGPFHEPMFVKNLENVQGDERDVILLSFGYGKNEAGKFLKNFGPLSKPGGERRLNVAVTRAREAVTLVASVRSADMDLSGSTSVGANLLKAYLDYAEKGVDTLSRTITATLGGCESPFEEDVAAALMRHGLEPVSQVGCGGFRIDLALKHPTYPGIYCLGIECDGATYHSSKTARDRDRIRQSILEGLGWRICRVWSTDWIRNPELQIQRILAEYEQVSKLPPDAAPTSATQSEVELEDLKPQYILEDEASAPKYWKIDDVPTRQIIETAIRLVTRVGTVDWSELVSLTSRELGFARTGKKIRERIESVLQEQVRQSNLHRSGDRVSLSS